MESIFDNEFLTAIKIGSYKGSGTSGILNKKDRKYHGLVFRIEGKRKYTFDDGQEFIHEMYDIIYLPKHSNYQVKFLECGDCYAIDFDLYDDKTYAPFKINLKNPKTVQTLFKDTHSNWMSKNTSYYQNCMKNLYQIFAIISAELKNNYTPKSKEILLSPAIEYIRKNFVTETINIQHLASLCKVSEVYFRKVFKLVYGMSPIKYINNMKFEIAEEMLNSNLYSINEISDSLGYSSPSSFSRDFKKHSGISPGNYTREN